MPAGGGLDSPGTHSQNGSLSGNVTADSLLKESVEAVADKLNTVVLPCPDAELTFVRISGTGAFRYMVYRV